MTLAGVRLVWDGSNPTLESYRTVENVTRFTIYADEVLIAQALAWRGADVTIYARSLRFSGEGCIDTSPRVFAAPAFSDYRDKDGRPLAAEGSEEIRAADGQNGQKAGNISLNIAELDLGAAAKRFVCAGSPGQLGETGGTRPFPELKSNPNFSKDAKAVSLGDIDAAIRDPNLINRDLNGPDCWYYPGQSGDIENLYQIKNYMNYLNVGS